MVKQIDTGPSPDGTRHVSISEIRLYGRPRSKLWYGTLIDVPLVVRAILLTFEDNIRVLANLMFKCCLNIQE